MVLLTTISLSVAIAAAITLAEVATNVTLGNPHIGSSNFYLFLGADVNDINSFPWFLTTGIVLVTAYVASLVLYKVLKTRQATNLAYRCPSPGETKESWA